MNCPACRATAQLILDLRLKNRRQRRQLEIAQAVLDNSEPAEDAPTDWIDLALARQALRIGVAA